LGYPAVLLKVFSAEQPLSRRFTYLVGVDKNGEKKRALITHHYGGYRLGIKTVKIVCLFFL
jgi:hypothetical protein